MNRQQAEHILDAYVRMRMREAGGVRMSERKAYISMPRHNGERLAKLMVRQFKQMNSKLDNADNSRCLTCKCGEEIELGDRESAVCPSCGRTVRI